MVYIIIHTLICAFNNINSSVNNADFDLKSVNQEFLLLLKLLKKYSIQYFTIELWIMNWSLCYLWIQVFIYKKSHFSITFLTNNTQTVNIYISVNKAQGLSLWPKLNYWV